MPRREQFPDNSSFLRALRGHLWPVVEGQQEAAERAKCKASSAPAPIAHTASNGRPSPSIAERIEKFRKENRSPRNETAPDWAHWRIMPKLALWEAALLSLDIEPAPDILGEPNTTGLTKQRPKLVATAFRSDDRKRQCMKRLDVLVAYCDDPAVFSRVDVVPHLPHQNKILSREFVAFAVRHWGRTIPDALRTLAPVLEIGARPPWPGAASFEIEAKPSSSEDINRRQGLDGAARRWANNRKAKASIRDLWLKQKHKYDGKKAPFARAVIPHIKQNFDIDDEITERTVCESWLRGL